MGLIQGAFKSLKGAVSIATAPGRTALKMLGTGLETNGKVLGELATGDLKGAFDAGVTGAKKQVGNVTGYYKEQVGNVKDVAGGHAEFVQGGVGLIGTPIQGAARLAGNGLSTTGDTLTNLAEGDLNGAAKTYVAGAGNQVDIVGDTARQQLRNIF